MENHKLVHNSLHTVYFELLSIFCLTVVALYDIGLDYNYIGGTVRGYVRETVELAIPSEAIVLSSIQRH
jgi:hypothetical protein